MKLILNSRSIYFLISFALMIAIPVSCKKEKVTVPPTSLTTEKASYFPSELVSVTLENVSIDRAELMGTAEGKSVKVLIVNNVASFLVPDSAPGAVTISFQVNKLPYEVTLSVIALPEIKNPEVYVADIQASIADNAKILLAESTNPALSPEGRAAVTGDAKKYIDAAAEYKQQYEKLSDADKLEFARVMAANIGWINEMKEAIEEYRTADVADYEKVQSAQIIKLLKSVGRVAHRVALVSVLIYATPGIVATVPVIGTVGATLAITYLLLDICDSWTIMMVNYDEIYSTAVVPEGSLSTGDAIQHDYNNGAEKTFNMSGSFRKIMSGDQTNAEIKGTLKSLLDTYESFKQQMNDVLAKIPAKIRPSYVIPALKAEVQASTRFIHSKYITLSNMSNSKVTLTYQKLTNGSLKLKASTTEATDQTFTYDVNYSNPDFSSKTLTTKVTSKVIAVSPDYVLELYERILDIDINKVSLRAGPLLYTLRPNDALKVSPTVSYYAKLKYKGNYVKLADWANDGLAAGERNDQAIASFSSTKAPWNELDHIVDDYVYGIIDKTNNTVLKIPLKVTFSNDFYRSIVGKTLLITTLDSNSPRASLTLLPGGKIQTTEPAFSQYTWGFGSGSSSRYIKDCSNFRSYNGRQGLAINKKVIGSIGFDFKGASPAAIPSSIEIFEDGTGSAGVFFGYCNDLFSFK